MHMKTDYIPGTRWFTAWTEEGEATYSVMASQPVEALGAEFILYTEDERDEDGILVVYACKTAGTAGDMQEIATREEWMVIDGMVLALMDQGRAIHLETDDTEYFQVCARRCGYESAEQWLLDAIFGTDSRTDAEEDPGSHPGE